jgi:hypothetical protein
LAKNKQGSSGRKNRKKGDWEAIARGRSHRASTIVSRSNRDFPVVGAIGSAAYQRLGKKGK